jgi:hypothetical protein
MFDIIYYLHFVMILVWFLKKKYFLSNLFSFLIFYFLKKLFDLNYKFNNNFTIMVINYQIV